MRRWSPVIGIVAAIAATLPAAAQEASPAWLSLPRPADSGKAIIYDPQFVVKGEKDSRSGCTPGLQCRLQLRPFVAETLSEAYAEAREDALEETGLPEADFPAECPFNPDEVLSRSFLPER